MTERIQLELQYIDNCPNAGQFLERVREAISDLRTVVDLREVLVVDDVDAALLQFRGSPTLLINGQDLEGAPELPGASIACRVYPEGLPSVEQIRSAIDRHHS